MRSKNIITSGAGVDSRDPVSKILSTIAMSDT